MEILDGDEAGLARAAALVRARPHPEHLREARLILGREPDIRALVGDSLSNSSHVAHAVRGEDALLCGVSLLGIVRFQVWMTATAGASERPAWLWRESRRCLEGFDRALRTGDVMWQQIPGDYRRGLNFVRHLGFREAGRFRSPATGAELVRVERKVPGHDA